MKRQEKIDALNKMIEGVNEDMPRFDGLCGIVSRLVCRGGLSLQEFSFIFNLINRQPKNYNYCPYLWEKGEKEPRIKWLKEQIKKLEKK